MVVSQCGVILAEITVRPFRRRITYGSGWPNMKISITSGWAEFVRTMRRALSVRVRMAP